MAESFFFFFCYENVIHYILVFSFFTLVEFQRVMQGEAGY